MIELEVDDWLIFKNMGAYCLVGASKFNGIDSYLTPVDYILTLEPKDMILK